MKTVTSLSGGMSSATIEDLFPADKLVFALVRSNDKEIQFKDRYLAQQVSDRIGKDFIATPEDDTIIYTMIDLEQYFGKEIHWVTAEDTFEDLIKKRKYLPNIATRFCTTELKIRPIFHWWADAFNREPVIMNIGYRFGEGKRVTRELKKLNKNGLSEFKATFEKHPNGNNKWETVAWRKPEFPLFNNDIDKLDVIQNWRGKGVRFAEYNNCIACFHRSPAFLSKMQKKHPKKFDYFIRIENENKGFFKKEVDYQKIKDLEFTQELNFESEGCSSGFCGF